MTVLKDHSLILMTKQMEEKKQREEKKIQEEKEQEALSTTTTPYTIVCERKRWKNSFEYSLVHKFCKYRKNTYQRASSNNWAAAIFSFYISCLLH